MRDWEDTGLVARLVERRDFGGCAIWRDRGCAIWRGCGISREAGLVEKRDLA